MRYQAGVHAGRRARGRLSLLAILVALGGLLSGGLRPSLAAPADLDPSFDGDGSVITDFGGVDEPDDLVVQPDGKIVVVGGSSGNFALARYNADGSLDASFGTGGKVITDLGATEGIHAVALHADGKLVVAGETGPAPGGLGDWAIARYTSAGALDVSFGSGGFVVTDFGGPDVAQDILVQPDGKIVASGRGGDDFGIARNNPDGTLDVSFGTAGKVLTDLSGVDNAFQIALQSDGKIVAAGDGLVRYNANGTLDAGFGSGGRVVATPVDFIRGLSILPGGKIVVAGLGSSNFVIARYMANGSLDTSFGASGATVTDFGGNEDVFGLAVQLDGRMLVGGYTDVNGCCDFAVARYDANGSLDATFGTVGKAIADVGGIDALGRVALQPDGKILQVGYTAVAGDQNFGVVRYQGSPAPLITTLTVVADTYVRQGGPDTNEGASTFLRLQDSGNNRALVRFDQAAIQAAVGSGTLVNAKLQLTITDNGNNWGTTGRTVDAHRVTVSWAEGNGFVDGGMPPDRGTGAGATWNCAIDSNIANQQTDCSGATEWSMSGPGARPWVTTPTATVTITNGQSGVVEFDVTADVIAFLSGSATNAGWIVKKTNEGQPGRVNFGSRETSSAPKLVLTVQP